MVHGVVQYSGEWCLVWCSTVTNAPSHSGHHGYIWTEILQSVPCTAYSKSEARMYALYARDHTVQGAQSRATVVSRTDTGGRLIDARIRWLIDSMIDWSKYRGGDQLQALD